MPYDPSYTPSRGTRIMDTFGPSVSGLRPTPQRQSTPQSQQTPLPSVQPSYPGFGSPGLRSFPGFSKLPGQNGQNGQNGQTASQQTYDYSQPQYPLQYPNGQLGYPGNVGPVYVATQRTPFEMPTPDNSYSLQKLVQQYFGNVPNYVGTVQGPNYSAPSLAQQGLQVSPYATNALSTMSHLGYNDFGIPQSAREQMKVQAAQQVNSGIQAQREAAKRQMAAMGLLNDSASSKLDQQLAEQGAQQIGQQYSNIDTQSALNANQEYLQNLNNTMSGGNQLTQLGEQNRQSNLNSLMDALKLNEQGRQFNVTGSLDQNRLQNAIGQWIENTQENRSNILNSVANFLENLQLERQKLGAGVISDASKSALYDENTLANLLKTPDLSAFKTG